VKAATIGVRTLADYSVWLKDHQQGVPYWACDGQAIVMKQQQRGSSAVAVLKLGRWGKRGGEVR
jgi:hypothetical protein